MICPNCKRIINDNEICVCKLEAIRQKKEELRIEEENERKRIQEEEKVKQEALDKKKKIAQENAENVKNAISDTSTNIVKNIIDIIIHPDTGIADFVKEQNMNTGIVLIALRSLIFGFFMFSLTRSSASENIRLSGYGTVSIILLSFILSLLFTLIRVVAFFVIDNNVDKKNHIQRYLCLSSARYSVECPAMLLSALISAFSPALGVPVFIISYIMGSFVDNNSRNILNTNDIKFNLTLFLSYLFNLFIAFLILIKF